MAMNTLEQYAIYTDAVSNEVYYKMFTDISAGRHWIINHLDTSIEWTIKKC